MRTLLATLLILAALPAAAQAEGVPASCPGDPIAVDQVITGEFDRGQLGAYVMVPFDVPAGTTSVRVKYCHDQPDAPSSAQQRHTLDLGLYDPPSGSVLGWEVEDFLGWGGSSHPDVTITPQGFSSEEEYRARPRGHVPGRTTRGFKPSPIQPGRWAAELGVAAIVDQANGDADGKVAWRIEIERSSNPAFAAQPYEPADYNERPAKGAGWYEGDMHVHGEHSALGDATMTEVFDYAFGTARLDFVTLTDYVTDSAWGEIGRHQGRHRGRLIARSSEQITYRGHWSNQASAERAEYRTGPILERGADGALRTLREAQPPSRFFPVVRTAGGWTQVNHPTIFPSDQPGNALLCRGCPWDYSDQETNWRLVDAFEINTGPAAFGGTAPNPFTGTAIAEWDALRKRGFPITGVSVSDSHDAGQPDGPTESPIGTGRTVVYADELSEDGLRRAVQAGHAYVKNFPESPELQLKGQRRRRIAIMGDALPDTKAVLAATVTGATGEGWTMSWVRDGEVVSTEPIRTRRAEQVIEVRERGEYRIQVERDGVIHSVSNPIAVGERPRAIPAGVRAGGRAATLRLRALAVRRRGTRATVTLQARSTGGAPLGGVRVRSGRLSDVTDSRGRVTFTLTNVFEPGRFRATATGRGWRSARTTFRVR